ncbi:DotU family type IV/VI secretion system protein [Pseudoalteromonas sp. APC 3224]|uniref:DotU family type IV/VI secretion system protein n=1 Tax=Pseudoalteromonas sp. APC 3224 TaxID=3035203 RepID=UPI0033A6C80B
MTTKYWLIVSRLIISSQHLCQNVSKENVTSEQIQALHNEMLKLIHRAYHQLKKAKGPVFAKSTLIPVAIFLDEWILTTLFTSAPNRWPLLQSKCFKIKHGGVLLYQLLDKYLAQPSCSNFTLEIYYFVVKSGFKGALYSNEKKRNNYLKILTKKLS